MPSLTNYQDYLGQHPVSGSIANALAYTGTRVPHTGHAFSEALLAGIAGGVMIGYFLFEYEGHDPQINIVTRNSFHDYGFETIADRLGLVREVYQTTSERKARENLIHVLEMGDAPIVTADVFGLGYERSEFGSNMWAMQPLVVSAYEAEGEAKIADRSRVALTVPAESLDAARGRIKKDRHRIVTVEYVPKDDSDLAAAIEAGIHDCLALYTEKPPAGSANNFGFRALERWIAALRKPTGKTSWHKLFPGGRRLFAALSSAYFYTALFWKDDREMADRALYAQFLTEAAEILPRPGLSEAAEAYREAAHAWKSLAYALLPDDEPLLAEERRLCHETHSLFLDEGTAAQARRTEIAAQRAGLRDRAENLATDETHRSRLFLQIADTLGTVLERERAAHAALAAAMKVAA